MIYWSPLQFLQCFCWCYQYALKQFYFLIFLRFNCLADTWQNQFQSFSYTTHLSELVFSAVSSKDRRWGVLESVTKLLYLSLLCLTFIKLYQYRCPLQTMRWKKNRSYKCQASNLNYFFGFCCVLTLKVFVSAHLRTIPVFVLLVPVRKAFLKLFQTWYFAKRS